ncbi:MAG TPA: hypothetical protein VFH37_02240 [Candidatus Saccharimonadales bacterium]|nr:hypothetical protein [Candidatus Saccharimonadales bacterium]
MTVKNKKSKAKAYQLILLCIGGLVLGSIIPLIASAGHSGTSKDLLIAMEVAGTAALAYVFGLYLLKK